MPLYEGVMTIPSVCNALKEALPADSARRKDALDWLLEQFDEYLVRTNKAEESEYELAVYTLAAATLRENGINVPVPWPSAIPKDDVESDEPTALDVLLGIVSGLMLSFSVAEIRLAVDHISELGEEHWEAFEKYQETVVAPQWDHVERRLKRTPPKREH